MKGKRGRVFGLAVGLTVIASLLAAVSAPAKGNFSSLLVINLTTGEFRQIDDLGLQGFFALSNFQNGSRDVPAHGQGYEIWRVGEGQRGGLFAFDHLRYYPPGSQPNGYVFYEGVISGASEYDQRWFPSSPEGDALFEVAIARSATAAPPTWPWKAATLAALLIGAVSGYFFGRHRTASAAGSPRVNESAQTRAA